jgi:TRAP-type C4-dicarboxylate transport system substrate-binding protein
MKMLKCAAAAGTAAAGLVLSLTAASAEPITLKIADSFPQGHVIYDTMVNVMIPALEEGGKIEVEYFPANQLGQMQDVIEAVRGGVADIGYVAPGVVAGKMPATNILSLPGLFASGEHLAEVFMQMVEGSLKREYDALGIKIIMASGTPPYQVFTAEKPVRLPADAVGLKLRGGGGDADDFARAMGVSVVNMAASQMYESIQRGVIDGAFYLQATAPANHLQEVTKYATEGAPLMSLLALYFVSQERWDSFPPDIQEIITNAGRKAAIAMGREYDRRNVENRSVFIEAGGEIAELTPKEIQAWRVAYQSAPENLIAKLEGRGFGYVREAYEELTRLTAETN